MEELLYKYGVDIVFSGHVSSQLLVLFSTASLFSYNYTSIGQLRLYLYILMVICQLQANVTPFTYA